MPCTVHEGSLDALTQEAWRQCYLDPARAGQIGHALVERGATAVGWLHVAFAEVRCGDADRVVEALAKSRAACSPAQDIEVLALCDEIEAIRLRRAHDVRGSRALHEAIDRRGGRPAQPMHDFIANNSRAITAKLLGEPDAALRAFYAAFDAALRTGLEGPIVTALGNLGGYHLDLFNLEDARSLIEQAWSQAQAINASQACDVASANLITICLATGDPARAHELALALSARQDRFTIHIGLACLAVGDLAGAERNAARGALTALSDGDGALAFACLKTRIELMRGNAVQARATAQALLDANPVGTPFDLYELLRAATDACEQVGDLAAALAYARRAHAVYEELVGRSARARYIALEVRHELESERDSRTNAEQALKRVSDLNRALQAKIDETELLHAKLREQALRDTLTGLHNRRYLFEVGPGLLELSRRTQEPLAVALLDLDRFKSLNDQFGHEAGDLVLRHFADLLVESLRRSDVVCRHGGEEFVVLMPNTDAHAARTLLERVQSRLRAEPLRFAGQSLPPCSFSGGVAQSAGEDLHLERLLSIADQELYRAKSAGRTRIEVSTGSPDPLSGRCVPVA